MKLGVIQEERDRKPFGATPHPNDTNFDEPSKIFIDLHLVDFYNVPWFKPVAVVLQAFHSHDVPFVLSRTSIAAKSSFVNPAALPI